MIRASLESFGQPMRVFEKRAFCLTSAGIGSVIRGPIPPSGPDAIRIHRNTRKSVDMPGDGTQTRLTDFPIQSTSQYRFLCFRLHPWHGPFDLLMNRSIAC